MNKVQQVSKNGSKNDYNLTAREIEVLQLLAKPYSITEIANILSVSRTTVIFHFNNIVEKLAVNDRTGAVSVAIQNNIITQ